MTKNPNFKAERLRVANRTTPDPVFGLVRFTTNAYCARSLIDSSLRVAFGRSEARFPIAEVGRDRSNNVWSLDFHLNSHLVPDGKHELTVSLGWPDGMTIDLGSQVFRVKNVGGLAQRVARELAAYGTPVIFGRTVDSSLFPYAVGAAAWFDTCDLGSDTQLSVEPMPSTEAAHNHMVRWGFTVLPDVVSRRVVDGLNREVDAAIANGALPYRLGSSDRILMAHTLPHGRQVWLHTPVLEFLRTWFRDEPCACQTLYFMNGSEQSAHQDTIHLTAYPAGYMCGVWVALQDVEPNSGELFVYPGSHRTPRVFAGALGLHKVENDDYSHYTKFDSEIAGIIGQHQFERLVYRPKAGQVLVWHENLIHGGCVRQNPDITRRSIVSHYFARGSVAYYDSRGEAASLEDGLVNANHSPEQTLCSPDPPP